VRRHKLSVTIITYNEEDRIGDCIKSVAWADEVVVVDSGSEDRTQEIARSLGARVVEHPFQGHVQQKNFAIEQAKNEWILSLDADERASEKLRAEIEEILSQEEINYDGFYIPRKVYYLGRWILHGGWYPDYKIRLFRKGKGKWGGRNPHDSVRVEGKCGRLRGEIYHYTYRDIAHNMRTINSFSTIGAEELFREGKQATLFSLLIRPPWTFIRKYFIQRGFLDGMAGFIIAVISAYYVFCKYAKLWELQHLKGGKEE